MRALLDRLLRFLGLRASDPAAAAAAEQHDREQRRRAWDDRRDGRGPPIVGG